MYVLLKKTTKKHKKMQEAFKIKNITNFFKISSKTTVFNLEKEGEIPTAERIQHGHVSVRKWSIDQIPEIGKKIGFLKKPNKQKIICKYIQKGGVLKTTTTFNEARIFALNGLKTLIIGLDSECSISDAILTKKDPVTLNENKGLLGLYSFLSEKTNINQVIQKTNIPTLDIIPESHDLILLEKWLNQAPRKEYFFKDKLIPFLKDYDVILFDNSPSWGNLVENAIVASNNIICPLGCNLLAFNAAKTNIQSLFEFIEVMKLKNERTVTMFATLLERNSLSQQIFAQYLAEQTDYIIPIPIRNSVKFQESLISRESILEYAPNTPIANEYFDLITTLWKNING